MMARITIEVALAPNASGDDVGQRLFDFLAADPFDQFPEIETVDGWYVIGDD